MKISQRCAAAALAAGLIWSLAACGPREPVPDNTPAETPVQTPVETPVQTPSESPTQTGGKSLLDGVKPTETDAIPALTEAQRTALTDFGLRLLRPCIGQEQNVLLSPMSVLTALTMTANGAAGETRRQMETALGLETEELNQAVRAYWSGIRGTEGGALRPANSIWFTDSSRFTVSQSFLQACAGGFEADIYQIPFDAEADDQINGWVSDRTDGMIPAILEEVPPDAILYLINALAFEAEWPEPYREDEVWEAPFHAPQGDQTVEYLHSSEWCYLQGDGLTGIVKPYQGGSYAFAALLPDPGTTPEQLLEHLDGAELQRLLMEAEITEVLTTIPKFETEFSTELNGILGQLGMPLAFEKERADFTGMGQLDGTNLYISQVLHKTYLSLGEQGTRAGAATAVAMNETTAYQPPEEPKEVLLDRPFVYLLLDTETGIPFFTGILTDPAN